MFQFNQLRKFSYLLFTFMIVCLFVFTFCGKKSYAMKVDFYSYDKVKKALPAKYRTSDYLYTLENGDVCISFATYNGGGDYKTSVRRTVGKNDFLYCVDFTRYIIFNKTYSKKNNIFNNELQARIAIAMQYGTTNWGKKADKTFTTGNAILDYYMTQVVIHSLIYDYGADKSNWGIQYKLLTFKSNATILEKKSDELYKFCKNADIKIEGNYHKDTEFHFKQNINRRLFLDGNRLQTGPIECLYSDNNAEVEKFERKITSKTFPIENISVVPSSGFYNAALTPLVKDDNLDTYPAGYHLINLSENISFIKHNAVFWKCSDEKFKDTNQSVCGMLPVKEEISDSIEFELLIGEAVLHKKDSITGENISDAVFELLQYNDITKNFEFYKHMKYNETTQNYESGNIYLSSSNKKGVFKIIEREAGENYLNDWTGTEFQITKDTFSYEFYVENQPILGKLRLKKTGEQISFPDNQFDYSNKIPLEGIKFGLFAAENIYLKNKILYAKDQKIADLITNQKGEVCVSDLIAGKYYVKELEVPPLYEINENPYNFTIVKDENNRYSEVNLEIINHLKKCEIQVFKYSSESDKTKIPLQGAKFGLFTREDIKDAVGEVVLKKDSFIQESVSDEKGNILFSHIPYAEYYIKELEAPKDYIINDGIILVSKKDFTSFNDDSKIYRAKKELPNQKCQCKVKISKSGERFTGFESLESQNGKFIRYITDNAPLKDVVFSLYNSDKHFLKNGICNSDGIVLFDNLIPGTYYYKETDCPDEFILEDKYNEMVCEIDHTEYNKLEVPVFEASLNNKLCSTLVSLEKYGEQIKFDKNGLIYNEIPLSGVVFGIYQDFDYIFPNEEKLLKGSCVGYMVTDHNGLAKFQGKIPLGKYYVKELKTNTGYDIDPNIYAFEVTADNHNNMEICIKEGYRFVNKLSKAAVQIHKTDANTGKNLKNVEFTLYNNKDEKIGVYKTDKNGNILVEDLPYGSYYFIETKCKNGYYSTNNRYNFILESEETIILNITNSPILKLGYNENYKYALMGILILTIFIILFSAFGFKRNTRR